KPIADSPQKVIGRPRRKRPSAPPMISKKPSAFPPDAILFFLGHIAFGNAQYIDGAPFLPKDREVARGVGSGHQQDRKVGTLLYVTLEISDPPALDYDIGLGD